MSSAASRPSCSPAASPGARLAFLVAGLSVCVPWIVYACFLLTEVVGYPTFLWAMLAFQATCSRPSRRNDGYALAALALAVLHAAIRLLVVVLPVALLIFELANSAGPRRLRSAARRTCPATACSPGPTSCSSSPGRPRSGSRACRCSAPTPTPSTAGWSRPGSRARCSSTRPCSPWRSACCPSCSGSAGCSRRSCVRGERRLRLRGHRARHPARRARRGDDLRPPFRCRGRPRPLPLLPGTARPGRVRLRPRLAGLAPPRAHRAAAADDGGILLAQLPIYGRLDIDAPAADINRYLRHSLGSLEETRVVLALAALLLTGLYLQAPSVSFPAVAHARPGRVRPRRLPRRDRLRLHRAVRLPGHLGASAHPRPQGSVFDWVDAVVGRGANVTMLPYPFLAGQFWPRPPRRDLRVLERVGRSRRLHRRSLRGDAEHLPQLALRFNQRSGSANISPDPLRRRAPRRHPGAALRQHAARRPRQVLIDTGGDPWRADWISRGLDDDGWTMPGRAAQLRLFPQPARSIRANARS